MSNNHKRENSGNQVFLERQNSRVMYPGDIPLADDNSDKDITYFIVYSQMEYKYDESHLRIYNNIIKKHPILWINEENEFIKNKSGKLMLINWKILNKEEKNFIMSNNYQHKEYTGDCSIM